jgi:hypothetical protein
VCGCRGGGRRARWPPRLDGEKGGAASRFTNAWYVCVAAPAPGLAILLPRLLPPCARAAAARGCPRLGPGKRPQSDQLAGPGASPRPPPAAARPLCPRSSQQFPGHGPFKWPGAVLSRRFDGQVVLYTVRFRGCRCRRRGAAAGGAAAEMLDVSYSFASQSFYCVPNRFVSCLKCVQL